MNTKLLEKLLQESGGINGGIDSDNIGEYTKRVVQECVRAVERTSRHAAITTYDWQLVEGTIKKSAAEIREHWQL